MINPLWSARSRRQLGHLTLAITKVQFESNVVNRVEDPLVVTGVGNA